MCAQRLVFLSGQWAFSPVLVKVGHLVGHFLNQVAFPGTTVSVEW